MIATQHYDQIKSMVHQGYLVVYPTDTLYALGANVFDVDAVDKVYHLKKRPRFLPLPIAVSSITMMAEIAQITPLSQLLITHFLPGPLTLILKNKTIPRKVSSKKDTIALRIPDDPIALALLEKTGPLTVTSANIHDHQTPFTVEGIRNMFKSPTIVSYIDDGIRKGSPSTIVDVTQDEPVILRQGQITKEQINAIVT